MVPRFVGRLGPADAVTTANAALGFLAVVVAFADLALAARLVLLAAIADGLDGVLARRYGGSEAGPYLDSLADVASFGVAPAVVVYAAVDAAWPAAVGTLSVRGLATTALPALFVAAAVVRLALYTAYDADDAATEGVQSTLAATIIGAAVLAGVGRPVVLLSVTAAFVYLMLAPVEYPDLLARDALLMGVVHALAVLAPTYAGRSFPFALLTLGLAYLLFSPFFYWREAPPPVVRPDADGEGKGNA
jgi:CDP-diacylglycerol--serine O-phosphatidyltransferase